MSWLATVAVVTVAVAGSLGHADGGRGSLLLGVVDEPVGDREAADHADSRLDDVGVGDGEETTAGGVGEADDAGEEHGASLGDVEDVREDDAHAHEVTREEAEEGAAGADGGADLHDLAVLLAVDVREGEDELFVHLVREEDAVEDERESKADGEDRSVVEVVLVGEVGVTQERVAVDGLRREGEGDNEEGQGPAGDEEVLSLAADEVEGAEADGAEKGDHDADTHAEPAGGLGVRGGARDGADIHLAARIRERDGRASETGLMCGIRTGRDIVNGTFELGFARRGWTVG